MTEITQADWDAGLDLLSRHFSPPDRPITINVVAEAFARHRQYGYDQGYYDGRQADGAEERAKIVAWLREAGSVSLSYGLLGRDLSAILEGVADAMEAGDHETFTRSSDT